MRRDIAALIGPVELTLRVLIGRRPRWKNLREKDRSAGISTMRVEEITLQSSQRHHAPVRHFLSPPGWRPAKNKKLSHGVHDRPAYHSDIHTHEMSKAQSCPSHVPISRNETDSPHLSPVGSCAQRCTQLQQLRSRNQSRRKLRNQAHASSKYEPATTLNVPRALQPPQTSCCTGGDHTIPHLDSQSSSRCHFSTRNTPSATPRSQKTIKADEKLPARPP